MISRKVDRRVRVQAQNRCGYCLSSQKYILGKLEVDHIIARASGGTDDEANLWLACRLCNGFKAARTLARDPITGRTAGLFNPRVQKWERHFKWSENGTHIIGRTTCGRATVIALKLNNVISVMVRGEWVAAGWHPPKE